MRRPRYFGPVRLHVGDIINLVSDPEKPGIFDCQVRIEPLFWLRIWHTEDEARVQCLRCGAREAAA